MRLKCRFIVCVAAVPLLGTANAGCSKTLKVREITYPSGVVLREGEYRNTGFNTNLDGMSLEQGGTKLRVEKYNAESKSFEVAEKAIDLATQAAITAGKAGVP